MKAVAVAVFASCLILLHPRQLSAQTSVQPIVAQSHTSTALAPATGAAPAAQEGAVLPGQDISRDIVDTTMARLPTAADLGPWEYSRALFLLGDLSVYSRTHDPRYLAYARAWADLHIDKDGSIDHPIDALDFVMPGNVAVTLYEATGDIRYKLAANKIAAVFAGYPRTSDGGFWHASNNGRQHQLWADGTFMALPFLVRQGAMSGHAEEADREAVHQLLVYGNHLRDANGPLYFHAYDESGKALWANPVTHQSTVKWARAIGWYGIALVEVLDALQATPAPASDQDRAERRQLLTIVQNLARDLTAAQDPATGLWFQIIDKPKLEGNFLETSSSSMFTYFLDVAVKRGYIASSYQAAAERGYRGVMSTVVLGADGHHHITGICEGTNVGMQQDYLARKLYTDDFHGLGAFLLMNEEVKFDQPELKIPAPPAEKVAKR